MVVREIQITKEKQNVNRMNSGCFHLPNIQAIGTSQPEVRLTKFVPLPSSTELAQTVLNLNKNRPFQCQANEHKKNLWASNLRVFRKGEVDHGQSGDSNFWHGKSNINTMLSSSKLIQSLEAELAIQEPFQVVWRRLSFEVDQSNYGKLLGKALGQTAASWLSRIFANQGDKCNKTTSSWHERQKRIVFENLNGYVRSGELSAILGPSGSGKTSLLNAICGQKTRNYRGSIQLIGARGRRMRLSIIPQKDFLMENLTVQENLMFSSLILNPERDFDHETNVLRVVKMLNLNNCLRSKACHISGGEYKRVSIAQELLIQPDILVLDEPTSGLDSLNCKNLIKSLVQLISASRSGIIKPIAIIMTIHQPDVDIFSMFDHVYCMARHGRVIFDGRPRDALERIKKEAGINFDSHTLSEVSDNFPSTNPANLLIEIASEDVYGQEPIDRLSLIQRQQFEKYYQEISTLSQPYSSSDSLLTPGKTSNVSSKLSLSCKHLLATTDKRQVNGNGESMLVAANTTVINQRLERDKRLNANTDHRGHFWYHTRILTRRAFSATIRDPLMTTISIMFHFSIPFIFWIVYSNRSGSVGACPLIQRDLDVVSIVSNNTMNKMEELQEDLSLAIECSTMFFLSTYSFSMCSLSIAALAFPLNMHILLKEVRNGWYNLSSYVVAKTLASIPFEVIFPVISVIMIYLMLGMPGSYLEWRLWAIALVMALVSMISHSQGLIFGALCMNSVQTAIFLASSSTLPQTLLSGFTARVRHMPYILQKLSWLSQYRYSSDAVNIVRFGFGICPCDKSTDEYLRKKETSFTDIPSQMKPLFTYYITNVAEDQSMKSIGPSEQLNNGSTNTLMMPSNHSIVDEYLQIPGISYDLTLNTSARNKMIKMIENDEVDLFGRMADMMARSFTFGRAIGDCDQVRSELLTTSGTPSDEYLPLLFCGLFGLLVVSKLILFIIVKVKIGNRV